jgi:hypothetical protein
MAPSDRQCDDAISSRQLRLSSRINARRASPARRKSAAVEASVASFNVSPARETRRLNHVLQLSENIKIAGGNDATTIELPYLIQQSLFRIGERQGAASVGAMIEHQQVGFDALASAASSPEEV